jgi:hypothetical protein
VHAHASALQPPTVEISQRVDDEGDAMDFYSSEEEVNAAHKNEAEEDEEEEEFYEDEEDEEIMAKRAAKKEERDRKKRRVSVQFKQISLGEVYSCGITLIDEDLMCWNCQGRKRNPKMDPPLHMKGPFRQVSVGRGHHVCAIRRQTPLADASPELDYHSNRHLIELDEQGFVKQNRDRFLHNTVDIEAEKKAGKQPNVECWPADAHIIKEEARWWPIGWDQIHSPHSGFGPVCMVSMDSELFCFDGGHGAAIPDIIVA